MYFCIGNIARSKVYIFMDNSDYFVSNDLRIRLKRLCSCQINGVEFALSYFMYDDSVFSRDFRRGYVFAPFHVFDGVDHVNLEQVFSFLISPDLAELIYNFVNKD